MFNPQSTHPGGKASSTASVAAPSAFPGRWVGATSLVLAPLLLLAGVLLRIDFDFFFPQQLAAYGAHPWRLVAAYSAFAAGIMLLWPAILTLAMRIAERHPVLAAWGGTMTILGLFARTFHAGVDHLAFQIVAARGVDTATAIVAETYGAYYILSALTPATHLGWVVLAVGAPRSGSLGGVRAVALGLMGALMGGVLKGSDWISVVATAGLCLALLPLGLEVLRAPPAPSRRTIARNALIGVGVAALFIVLGRLG